MKAFTNSILIFVFVVIAMVSTGQTQDKSLGVISFIQGNVEIYSQNQPGRQLAKLNDPVDEETMIHTTMDSKVEITWVDGAASTIGSNQTVNIGQRYQTFLEENLNAMERLWHGVSKLLTKQSDKATGNVAATRAADMDTKESLHWKTKDVNFEAGIKLFEEKKYKASISELRYVVDDSPTSNQAAIALVTMGLAYNELKQNDKAIEALKRYSKDFPKHDLITVAQQVLDELEK